MLFFSFFKSLAGKEVRAKVQNQGCSTNAVYKRQFWATSAPGAAQHAHKEHESNWRGPIQVTVELKNDLAINGTLHSVDQYMNIKLDNVKVVNEDKFPHMVRTFQVCSRDTARSHWRETAGGPWRPNSRAMSAAASLLCSGMNITVPRQRMFGRVRGARS
jgi:small nuclear ribonucleoprotein (snRNP)-like protein